MGHKRTYQFNNSKKYVESRDEQVKKKKLGWEDSWATDKKFLKSWQRVFYCKWCGQEMYADEYDNAGAITMSCRKGLCPGNIDNEMRLKIDHLKVDVKQMTNQWLFDRNVEF